MKRNNKILMSIGMAAVAGVVLAGCSGGTDGGGDSNGSGEVTTITLAAATFAEEGRGQDLEAWLEEFNSSQDEVRVEPASIPYPTFGSTILTQMGGGVGPDMIRFDMPEYSAAVEAGLLEPLDEMIDASKYDLIKSADKFMVVDDVRYGAIFEIANYALIYNTDLVPEPPTTYQEFVDAAVNATTDTVFGLAFRHTMAEEAGMWTDVWNYVYGFGGEFSDGKELTLNSPDTIKGVEAYKELYDLHVIPEGTPAATFRTMFGDRLVAMEIDNGGVAGNIQAMNDALNINAAPIPFPVKSQGAILAPLVVNAASEHKEATATFLNWMLEQENQEALQEVMGASSVATKTERSAEALKEKPYLAAFDALTETGLPHIVQGFEAQTPDIRKIVVEQIIAALQGEKDVKTAMNEAQERAVAAVG